MVGGQLNPVISVIIDNNNNDNNNDNNNNNNNKVKTCKRWQAAHLHRRETFENLLYIDWGELFQGSYSLIFEPWYSLYIADQDTARYSLCSARENCVSWAEPLKLKCTTDNLFSLRVFLLNLGPVYEICLLKNIIIFP